MDPMQNCICCNTKKKKSLFLRRGLILRLEELMRVKQAERRQREQDEELEREKQRRKQGQELQQIRQKLQEDDMKKLADQRRKEKMEDKLARYGIDYTIFIWIWIKQMAGGKNGRSLSAD